MTEYDAILIGSGIGALTVAAGLARCAVSSSNRISNLGGMTQELRAAVGW